MELRWYCDGGVFCRLPVAVAVEEGATGLGVPVELRPGDQRERWIGSALLFAEQKFQRIVGYKALRKLIVIGGYINEQPGSYLRL